MAVIINDVVLFSLLLCHCSVCCCLFGTACSSCTLKIGSLQKNNVKNKQIPFKINVSVIFFDK
jgi:hypothetical protein